MLPEEPARRNTSPRRLSDDHTQLLLIRFLFEADLV